MKTRKLISTVLAMFLLLGVCIFNAAAEDNITAESLASGQLTNYIVNDLALPAGYTWSSSNTEVITDDGVVTRPIIEDAVVTMTGTDATETKSFTFTVKARTTKVSAQESFYAPELAAQTNVLANGLRNWRRNAASDAAEQQIRTDAAGNYYLYLDYTQSSNVTSYTFAQPMTGSFELNWDMAYDYSASEVTSKIIDVYFNFTGVSKTNPEAEPVSVSVRSGRWDNGNIRYFPNDVTTHTGVIVSDGSVISLAAKFDLNTLQYTFGKNGALKPMGAVAINQPGITNSDYTWSLCGMEIRRGAFAQASGIVKLDNFLAMQQEDLSGIIAEMSDSEVAALALQAITQDTLTAESAAALRSNLTLPAVDTVYANRGVSLTWRSQNPGISDTGVVTQAALPQTGAVTATVTVGSITVEKAFEMTVAPAGTANYDASLTFDLEDKAGSVVTDNAPFGTNSMTSAEYVTAADKSGSVVLKATSDKDSEAQIITKSGTKGGTYNDRFMLSGDFKYEAAADAEQANRFAVCMNGAGPEARIVFNFNERTVSYFFWSGSKSKESVMPEDVQPGQWFHLDVDFNAMSRSYKIYINGEALSAIPNQSMMSYNSNQWYPMRTISLSLIKPGTLYADNVAVNRFTDADAVKADAALNAVLITYTGYNIKTNDKPESNEILTKATLPSEGPVSEDGKTPAHDTGDTVFGNHSEYTFKGGAALTYKVNGAPVSGTYIPKAAETAAFEVTATSGSRTATASFVRKSAPVSIKELNYESPEMLRSIVLDGTPGGKVFVAAYKGEQLVKLESYAASENITVDYAIPEGSAVKVFVLSETGIQPLAYTK